MKSMLLRPVWVASVLLALTGAVASAAQAGNEQVIPGYTDFPNHLRVESVYDRAGEIVPGYSDFPNHLRVESVYDRARAHSGTDGRVIAVGPTGPGGFDWVDAGIGAGGAAAVLLLGAGLTALAVRRPIRRTALTA